MDPVRAEVFGPKGLAKLHRSRHFPDTAGMAALAAELYDDVHGRLVDAAVDTALDRLLVLEFNEFKRREGEWATSILETLMATEIHQYPNCYTIAQNYIEAAKSNRSRRQTSASQDCSTFSDSQAQSRKTRAGSASNTVSNACSRPMESVNLKPKKTEQTKKRSKWTSSSHQFYLFH